MFADHDAERKKKRDRHREKLREELIIMGKKGQRQKSRQVARERLS